MLSSLFLKDLSFRRINWFDSELDYKETIIYNYVLIKLILQDFLLFVHNSQPMFQKILNQVQMLIIYLPQLKLNVIHSNQIYFRLILLVHNYLHLYLYFFSINLQLLRTGTNFLSVFQFFPQNFPSWIRIRILNADPDSGGKINADPDSDPQP